MNDERNIRLLRIQREIKLQIDSPNFHIKDIVCLKIEIEFRSCA